jgi:GNAT superfamily N-acetyltransferase
MTMRTTAGTIRLATAADVPALAATIADAFFDDPTMLWIAPDDERRRVVGPAAFRPSASSIERLGGAWITEDGTGAALWIPPGGVVPAEDEAEAFGQQLAEVLDGGELERLEALMAAFDEHLPTEPHAHLQLHGVRPTAQGRGLGSALLEAVLPRLDRDGVPAYLEATNDGSRRLYERHGFEHLDDFAPALGGPTLRRMWREPRRAR